jgi:hypothetical protein
MQHANWTCARLACPDELVECAVAPALKKPIHGLCLSLPPLQLHLCCRPQQCIANMCQMQFPPAISLNLPYWQCGVEQAGVCASDGYAVGQPDFHPALRVDVGQQTLQGCYCLSQAKIRTGPQMNERKRDPNLTNTEVLSAYQRPGTMPSELRTPT